MFRFSRIKKHLTPSTLIAIIALVFAITGGAFAATGATGGGGSSHGTLTASAAKSKAKAKAKAGPRGPAGKNGTNGTNGAPGATGPAGPAGTNGTGTPGTNGTNGTNGKSVLASAASEAECKEKVGGTKFEVEGAGKSEHVCNGKNGTTGFTGTLPKGATETGEWTVSGPPKEGPELLAPMSFAIPLPAPLDAEHVHFVTENGLEEAKFSNFKFEIVPTSACPGTSEAPKAEPGNLCVYQTFEEYLEEVNPGSSGVLEATIGHTSGYLGAFMFGAGTTGAVLKVFPTSEEQNHVGFGSWAVTG